MSVAKFLTIILEHWLLLGSQFQHLMMNEMARLVPLKFLQAYAVGRYRFLFKPTFGVVIKLVAVQ